jgi:hypothetical protein
VWALHNIALLRQCYCCLSYLAYRSSGFFQTQLEDSNGFVEYKGSEKFKEKSALITGGDSGIGRAVAVLYV